MPLSPSVALMEGTKMKSIRNRKLESMEIRASCRLSGKGGLKSHFSERGSVKLIEDHIK